MQEICLKLSTQKATSMQYQINWPEYNNKNIGRGEINLDVKLFKTWNSQLNRMNLHKEGHQFEYPDSFILFLGLLKVNFGFTYRKLKGFIRSIAVFCPLLSKTPDYTTIFRRMNRLKLDIFKSIPESKEPLFISIDSSGLKADHGGTWIEQRFGRKKRHWIKIHFAIDVKSKRIIEVSVTTDRVHDNRRFRGLVKRASKKHKIDKVAADAAYDDHKNYELLHKKRMRPAIKPRMNSNPDYLQPRYDQRKFWRWKHLLLFDRYTYDTWKKKTGYNYRTLNESVFSAFKAGYGDGVYSKKFEYARNEVIWKAYAYNLSR